MELTEVVSPTVAVPVFGVLLCAFLVFAFGFKSPAQPPSFNFDEDTKKKKLKKPKHSKGQSNGHIVSSGGDSDDAGVNTKSSPKQTKAVVKQSSPTANKTVSKKVEPVQPAKKAKKSLPKGEVKTNQQLLLEDEDGWTKQISRKGKKQRSKKDEKTESEKIEVVADEKPMASSAVKEEVAAKAEPEETPLEQRSQKKTKKKSQKDVAEGESTTAPVVLAPVEPTPAPASVVSTPVEPTPAHAVPSPATEQTKNDEKPSQEETPVRKNKGKKKSGTPPPQSEVSVDHGQKVAIAAETGSPTKQEDVEVNKAVKSPKKKKKVPVESVEPVLEVKSEPVVVKDVETTLPAAQSTPPVPPKIDSPSDSKESSSTAVSKEASTDNKDSSVSTPQAVSFDELGESWIEAKPKSKKKKVRREN